MLKKAFALIVVARRMPTCILILALLFIGPSASGIDNSEFQNRRKELMRRVPNGIVLLHARSDAFSRAQLSVSGFQQDASFYYFTGLERALGAILAVDGTSRESWLFVPTHLSGTAGQLSSMFVTSGSSSESSLGIEHVVPWNDFVSYIEHRTAVQPNIALCVDAEGSWFFGNESESNPPGLEPISDSRVLWLGALSKRWPEARIQSVSEIIYSMQLVKSEAEIDILRHVGKVSAAAAVAGIRSVKAGQNQRVVEAEVIRECIHRGGEGPSFWPWIMSGRTANLPTLLEAGTDYHHIKRGMQPGELAHVDIGCELDHYSNDVGRTVPVSGHFDVGQREVWYLLTSSFKAGLSSIREGVGRKDILAAAEHELRQLQSSLKTEMAQKAATELIDSKGTEHWLLHGVGVECCQHELHSEVLHTSMVIVFEAALSVDGQEFYLEDMVLVTPQGREVLTADLPYSAEELEALVGTAEAVGGDTLRER
jgi:Xaa-Pro aminopeptidase